MSSRERKRRQGYTKNLAHIAAHFTTGYQIGFDLDLLPRRGSGVIAFDLVRSAASLDGQPFECQTLHWLREMCTREVERLRLDAGWVKRATVELRWTWLGENYALVSTGEVETDDALASVTIHNTQPPLPSPLRKESYDLTPGA